MFVSNFEDSKITDIDNRLIITSDNVPVNYYTIEDIKKEMSTLVWMFTDYHKICEIINNRNAELHKKYSEILKEKNLPPCIMPCRFVAG